MRRKSQHPLKKHTTNLYEGDMETLRTLHPELGAGMVLREVVRAYIRKIQEQHAQTAAAIPQVDVGELMK